jgi:allograft inflammatory factor 1
MGQAKTHLELKKIIAEVDTSGKGVIDFRDFLRMMTGSKSSLLKKFAF